MAAAAAASDVVTVAPMRLLRPPRTWWGGAGEVVSTCATAVRRPAIASGGSGVARPGVDDEELRAPLLQHD